LHELRHSSFSSFLSSFYLALKQANVNQLPGSSDVSNWAISVGSSVSDITTGKLSSSSKISQNEDGEDRANPESRNTVCLDYFEARSFVFFLH